MLSLQPADSISCAAGHRADGGLEMCTAALNGMGCFLLKDKVSNEKINKL